MGLGKSTYTFSAEHLGISAPRQASVGRASRRGSGKRKSADVEQKMYSLIYLDPTQAGQQAVTKAIAMIIINLLTPTAGAKNERLFHKPASRMLKNQVRLEQHKMSDQNHSYDY